MNMSAWREVAAPFDIDELLERYGGFHDACIVSLNYVTVFYGRSPLSYRRAAG